ncbi:52 kDa repressor of the inhibitor of the protein kinase-like, partial [Saccostrea cucullata]|uniref:52 kDa repressor of the inhibitor of the protein kinase-like n=1 Tax=Saccostrea cuccullata TaxID=36930 RepID=UPI002ED4FCE9
MLAIFKFYRSFGTKSRRFQPSWLKDHHWMRYSISTDSVFCAYCFLFGNADSKEKSFLSSPMTDWKNLLSIARRHENLAFHKGCVTAGEEFVRVSEGKGDTVVSMLSSSHKKHTERNRHILKTIIEVLLLCGRQNIPIRGHTEDKSNFIAILSEFAKRDPVLSDHLATRHASRSTYLSPDIQNELINLLGNQVRKNIVDSCRNSKFLGIIADECTDSSTKEQMSLCIRFLDSIDGCLEIREEFVGFKYAESVKGMAVSNIIIDFLAELNLNIQNLRAQCYDGAANMSGKYSGVQARILQVVPEASYVHCKAHSLNLALIHSSKVMCIRNMMSTVQDVAFCFDYSAKRLKAFSDELAENDDVQEQMDRRTKLRTLCETRWSSRADSLFTFRSAFPVVVAALQSLEDAKDEKASQYLAAILRFEFIIALVVAEHVLSSTVALTNYLQKKDIDLLEAVTEAKVVIRRLTDERNDISVWDALYGRATEIAAEHDLQPCVPRRAGRQQHRENHPLNNPSDYWRVSLYLVFLDHLVNEISSRVTKNEERFLISYLLPAKLQDLTADVTDRLYNAYKSDLTSKVEFVDEITRWRIRWNLAGTDTGPNKIIDLLNKTNKDIYPGIFCVLSIFLTMPVSSASSERSFSAMRRVKNYLRTTMGDERMSNLSLLHVQRHMPVDIDATPTPRKFKARRILPLASPCSKVKEEGANHAEPTASKSTTVDSSTQTKTSEEKDFAVK